MNHPRTLLVSLMMSVACVTTLRAEDFDTAPILPIVPELGSHDAPHAAPKKAVAIKDTDLEEITFPSAPDDAPALEAIVPPAMPELPAAVATKELPVLMPVSVKMPVMPQVAPELKAEEPPAQVVLQQPAMVAPIPMAIEPPNMPLPATNTAVEEINKEEKAAEVAPEPVTPDKPIAPQETVAEPSDVTAPQDAQATAENGEAATDQPKISLGDFEISLMFAPEDIGTLKQVLMAYEIRKTSQTAGADQGGEADADLLAELLRVANGGDELPPDATAAPVVLPNFYLGTIVFNHKGDWSVWVNQQQMSSRKRQLPDLQMSVRGVNREYATLAWKPKDMVAAKMRWDEAKDAGLESAKKMKHREVRGARIDFDDKKGEFVIVMRANQTFAADTMQILEGRTSPIVKAEAAVAVGGAADPSAQTLGLFDPAGGAGNPASALQAIPQNDQSGTGDERAAANKLINNLKTATGAISGIVGGGSPPNAAPVPAPNPIPAPISAQ